MVDNQKEVRKQILDGIGMLAATITIIAYLLLCINAAWPFIEAESTIMNVLLVIKTYAPLVVVGIVGLEYVSTKNLIMRVIFYAAIALVVIFMFFPNTWSQFVGLVNEKI